MRPKKASSAPTDGIHKLSEEGKGTRCILAVKQRWNCIWISSITTSPALQYCWVFIERLPSLDQEFRATISQLFDSVIKTIKTL